MSNSNNQIRSSAPFFQILPVLPHVSTSTYHTLTPAAFHSIPSTLPETTATTAIMPHHTELNTLTAAALKNLCQKLNIATSGSKTKIIKRLQPHLDAP